MALFDWLKARSAGILLHPTAFPGNQGVGVLGGEARRFVDILHEAGATYWQILPLGPTGYGDSPYQSFSSTARNPYLIDLEALQLFGLLKEEELEPMRALPRERVDYGGLYQRKWPLLRLAHRRFLERKLTHLSSWEPLEIFEETHAEWLGPFARFMALKETFGGKPWVDWPEEHRSYASSTKQKVGKEVEASVRAQCFLQYVVFQQWQELLDYAHRRHLLVIGDVPIFVALDSADVWARPELFHLDEGGRPTVVAGVPPDYFAPEGQLWGNPLYRWDAHKKEHYGWWIERLRGVFHGVDVVRLDHFRGFDRYWEVDASAPNAREGTWRVGPRLEFFEAIREALPEACLIAEDLGEIDEGVRELREATGLPGMAILQFAFSCDPLNLYLPHSQEPNCIVYTGTHDNNTARGWYEEAPESSRDQLRRYFRVSGEDVAWDLLRAAYGCVSRLAVIPAQDVLGLGAEGRMNTPGAAHGNWQWRLTAEQLGHLGEAAPTLREFSWLYGREPVREGEEREER